MKPIRKYMKYIDDILHQLSLRRQLLVLHDHNLHVELLAESLKPVETEPDKTISMRYEDYPPWPGGIPSI